MSIFRKLNTLLRAGATESAERITDANAIRIYRQEIVDAKNLLERRRNCLAGLIATRKDLEREIGSAQQRIQRREQQVGGVDPEQRTEELLLLAAKDIAATETQLASLKHRHVDIAERIGSEERTLRKLLGEIREHRREIKILAAGLGNQNRCSPRDYRDTVAGHLATLRETRAGISGTLSDSDGAEASAAEAIERVDGDPLDHELAARGRDPASLQLASVLERLRGIACKA